MAQEYTVEEVSNEEKLQIAQHFLLSSPPSQFSEVLDDVRKLLPGGLLPDPLAAGIARAYNTRINKVVTVGGHKTVLTAAGEVDATHYIDSKTSTVFSVDHLTLATSESSQAADMDASLESQRSSLQTVLDAYVAQHYAGSDAAASVLAKDGKLIIHISGERPNLRNYWSGRWQSQWTLTPSGSNAALSGEIKLHAHYFEDGNVQLQTSKSIAQKTVPFTEVLDAIKRSENELQAGLEDMYQNMNEETLRDMRRVMTVSRTKMEWNVNAQRMVRNLRK